MRRPELLITGSRVRVPDGSPRFSTACATTSALGLIGRQTLVPNSRSARTSARLSTSTDHSPQEATTPDEAKHCLAERAFAPLESVARSRDDDAGEGAGTGRVPLECRDELRRTPVEVLIPTADDGRDRHADPSECGPASIGPVV